MLAESASNLTVVDSVTFVGGQFRPEVNLDPVEYAGEREVRGIGPGRRAGVDANIHRIAAHRENEWPDDR